MEELDMRKQCTNEFKEDAVRYLQDHADAGLSGCAKNLSVSKSALFEYAKAARTNKGEIPTRGSKNYESDEAKENTQLRRELRDTQGALEILKKAIGYWATNRSSLFLLKKMNSLKMENAGLKLVVSKYLHLYLLDYFLSAV